MQPPADRSSPLSVYRAFVVQFRAETDVAHGRITGQIEHVATGQVTRFQSGAEMWAFIAHILTQAQEQRPEAP